MRLTYNKPFRSIDKAITTEDLNDFVVITGPNGSGKSQLLEAIAGGFLTVDGIPIAPPENVKLYSINQLLVPNDGPLATNSLAASWQQFKTTVDTVVEQIRSERRAAPLDSAAFEAELKGRLVENNNVLTITALDELAQTVGKPIAEFTQWDFQNHAPSYSFVMIHFSYPSPKSS